MNRLEIILKGGLKSCCSTYSAVDLNELAKTWFESQPDIRLTIMDMKHDDWNAGELPNTAFNNSETGYSL